MWSLWKWRIVNQKHVFVGMAKSSMIENATIKDNFHFLTNWLWVLMPLAKYMKHGGGNLLLHDFYFFLLLIPKNSHNMHAKIIHVMICIS